jgi:hypothetical protein
MRILRVRPEQHAELRGETHLMALEAQSRNVALRRSNPRNRWVLYTNTDVLLVPRSPQESLSDILRNLPDGFYETPRFEIPEMLWEAAFDRRDPAGNLARLRDWSSRFHLNQVVNNFMPMRYDALGDFQVALREDMFAIHGFDEAMMLGWHCDSNLAARLSLYRGGPDTLVDKVFAYHCDHTRVPALNNVGRRTPMNDQDRFIWNLAAPFLPAQAESWGWPDVEIEEIRLNRDTAYERYAAGLSAAIVPTAEPYRTTNIEGNVHYDLTYDLPHTLPFVCNQVLTYPRATNVLLVGCRADFGAYFARSWQSMGFTGQILIPEECADLAHDVPGAEVVPFIEAMRRADLLIFEFGFASQGMDDPVRTGRQPTDQDRQYLRTAEKLFRRAVKIEVMSRPRDRRLPRRFIGVNVIYNVVWQLFNDHVSANINPFGGQVLAGHPRKETFMGNILRMLRRQRTF